MIALRLALVMILAPATAFAQQLPTVPSPAKPGPTVIVQDNRGAETKGRLLRLDVREAVLLIDGQERRFALADVRRIEKRGDSLKNGAIIGAGVGLLWGLIENRRSQCEPPPGLGAECGGQTNPLVAAASAAAIGGAIGVGIDAPIVGPNHTLPSAHGLGGAGSETCFDRAACEMVTARPFHRRAS